MADVKQPASGRDTESYKNRWYRDNADGTFGEEISAATRYWDVNTLSWVKGTQPGGGTGGGGAVTVADGADVAQGATTDASSANTVVGILKAIKAAITGTLTVATHAVTQSGAWSVTADTELPAAAALADTTATPTAPAVGAFGLLWNGTSWDRAPGDKTNGVKVQGTVAVSNFPGTQPVSIATNTPDVTDRAARLLGHVTVDAAPTTAVTGPLTDAQLRATAVPDNLTQVGGVAVVAKAVPANADGQAAIPVYVNAIQYATYDVAMRNIATGALTANTAKAVMSFEHAGASVKTVRIRRIMIHALQTTALAGLFDVQITKGTAASSAGTALVPNPRKGSDPASECVVKSLPTIVAATLGDIIPAGGFGATTALYSPPVLIYDWQEAGETKALQLRAGVLESVVLNLISTVAHNLTLTISVDFSEE